MNVSILVPVDAPLGSDTLLDAVVHEVSALPSCPPRCVFLSAEVRVLAAGPGSRLPVSLVDKGFRVVSDCGWWVLEWGHDRGDAAGHSGRGGRPRRGGVLDLARDAELMARQAERAKLRAANQWADLHAATTESGVEVWGHAGALDCEEPIGGPGTPALAAFSVEPFGAALGISTISAMNLISAAVELKHRLPQVWALMEDLEVPAWKPKMVARLTGGLSPEAAAYVDDASWRRSSPPGVARPSSGWWPRRSPGSTPSRPTEAEAAGKAAWDVTITHPGVGEWAGTSWLDATGDSVDLTKFGDLVADIARRLGEAGDPDTLEQRRAKAIGIVPTCTPAPTSTT